MITSKPHAVIDYLVGILLLVAPYVLGFADGSPAQIVPQVIGAVILLMSLMTAYEFSAAKIIPYKVHLVVDVIASVVLLLSPWLFGFADRIWWPHVLVGIVDIVVVALSWAASTAAGVDLRRTNPTRR